MSNPEVPELRTEYENARIIDYRHPQNPNNKIVITCEHATNDLPEEYSWTENDRRYFTNEHWGCDIGAFDMANALASELKCVFVHSLYSRLLVDVNRSLVSDTLFRKTGDGREVDLNKDMTYEEEQKRIKKYFIPYCEALREISLKVDPVYILSIHSFTPCYQGEERHLDIGVLSGKDSTSLSMEINKGMNGMGYISEENLPYDATSALGVIKSLVFAKFPSKREGITFEFRNDILRDRLKVSQLKNDTVTVIRNVCNCS
jgi:predicted N-formylglutamate amidohydrolase